MTKSKVWQYEEEVRAFCLEKNGPIKFDRTCLKEVYFGCNTTLDERQLIIDLLEKSGYRYVKLKEIVINDRTFNIEAIELKKR